MPTWTSVCITITTPPGRRWTIRWRVSTQVVGGLALASVVVVGTVLPVTSPTGVGDLQQARAQFHRQLAEVAAKYGTAKEVVWAQEETQNRGPWTFMFPRLLELFPASRVRYAGRAPSASPAAGSLAVHKREQEALVRSALE